MHVLVRTCGGSEVATLDAELSWRKEDVLAALPARTHDLLCEERVLIAGKELWSVASGKSVQTLEGHRAQVQSAVFSSDGQLVLTASHDGAAKLWWAASGECVRTLQGHRGAVLSAVFSPQGQLGSMGRRAFSPRAALQPHARRNLYYTIDGFGHRWWS